MIRLDSGMRGRWYKLRISGRLLRVRVGEDVFYSSAPVSIDSQSDRAHNFESR